MRKNSNIAAGRRELNLGLEEAGLSDLALSWLRSRNVRTVGEFIDIRETQLVEWRTCRAMRAEIVARQEAARRGEVKATSAKRGNRGGTIGALFEVVGWMVSGFFKLAGAIGMLIAAVIVLRFLFRMIL